MRRFSLPIISLLLLAAISCKENKKNTETEAPATVEGTPAADASKVPWRVGFRLDSSPKDVFIPRPGKPDSGTKIVSFIAKRAKDIATWERIELELADGAKEVLAPVDTSMGYELRQHEGAGVDLVLFAQDGSPSGAIGPLKRLHIYTKTQAVAAPRIDGKAVLVLSIDGTREELAPAALEAIDQQVIPGNNGQKAWLLRDVLASKIDITTIRSVKVAAVGETRSFGAQDFSNATFHLRHNSRGELRLKVHMAQGEDENSGIRDVARIDIELRKAK